MTFNRNFLLTLISIFILVVGCKQNAGESNQGKQTGYQDPLVVPTPEGYYEPKDLKKMNLLEMYNLGTKGKLTKDFPLKDEKGNDLDWSVMNDASKQLFMQIYVDEKGNPAEGVVYKMTDEIKTMIMKVRIVATPTPDVN